MKNFTFDIILYILSFAFIDLIFKSMILPEEAFYLFLTLLLVGMGMFLSKPLLTFLTVKVVFVTRLLAMSVILFGLFYALESFLPGFHIEPMMVQETDFGWISLKSFEFDKIAVMALLSFLTALLSSLVKFLDES